jgi:cyclopropane fatty-acyl-phospholipid synthase-like methyltransferase
VYSFPVQERDIVGAVVEYYEGRLATFGMTARGVDWKDERSQTIRFEQLVRALQIDPAARPFSLVDFGCGYGALLSFLSSHGLAFTYTGYDRSAAMIDAARRACGGRAHAVFTTDWKEVPESDFVVASGVFNVRLSTPEAEWREYVERSLGMLEAKARIAWAANFLTRYCDEHRKRTDLHYADPGDVIAWCQRSASRWITLLHDYDLYEFSIGVRRRPV